MPAAFFAGGSKVGARILMGEQTTAKATGHIAGYMRFVADDRARLLTLLATHPVVRHGGTVELCELPKS